MDANRQPIDLMPSDDDAPEPRYPIKARRMLTRPRQTAGNNAFLRECRKLFNDPIYRRCLAFVNDPAMSTAQGEDAARAYLAKI